VRAREVPRSDASCAAGVSAGPRRPHTLARMEVTGWTTDVFVSSADAWSFWQAVIGRPPDLRPDDATAEWIVRRTPEIALRVRVDPARAGCGRVGIGVDDLGAARTELAARCRDLPDVRTVARVISSMELRDPDGNVVAIWQDLLGT
jgi:hypothetical protein